MSKGFLWVIGIVAIAIIAGVFGAYISKFSDHAWGGPTEWGMFGDYVGGLANPLLSFLTIFLLIVSLYYQTQELAATREELAQSREAMQQANQLHDNNLVLQSRNNLRHQIERHFNETMSEFMACADESFDIQTENGPEETTINKYTDILSKRENHVDAYERRIVESNQNWNNEDWNTAAFYQREMFKKTAQALASLIEFSDSELLLIPAFELFNEAKELMEFSGIYDASELDPIEAQIDYSIEKRNKMEFPVFHKVTWTD